MKHTVHCLGAEEAHWLAGMSELAGNGHRVEVEGDDVTLDSDGLAVLAELPEDRDGHYDGELVWIGGTERPVYEQPAESA